MTADYGDTRKQILQVVEEWGPGCRVPDIQRITGLPRYLINVTLHRSVKSGDLTRISRGRYSAEEAR